MQHKEHFIKGIIEFFPRSFKDDRGLFFESYSKKVFEDLGINTDFVQDNQSVSHKNVLRGLHFQRPPYAQGKLVRVATGRVLDVAVDIRKNSPTFGQHVSILLDSEQNNMLYIPEGFAHGFLALEDNTIFLYKCTDYYNQPSEGGLLWNDPDLNIDWQMSNPTVSDKDKELPAFSNFESDF